MASDIKEAFNNPGDYWILPNGKSVSVAGRTHLGYAKNNLSKFGITKKEFAKCKVGEFFALLTGNGAIRISMYGPVATVDGKDKATLKRQADPIMDLLLQLGAERVFSQHSRLAGSMPLDDFVVEFL